MEKSEMFPATTKAVVKSLGARRDLISNKNINAKIEMLTLVKVHKKHFSPKPQYSICNKTLLHLLEEADVSPEYTEEVLMEDFTNLKYTSAGGCVRANIKAVGDVSAGLSAGVDSVGAASSFTLKKKSVDTDKLTDLCNDKKIKQKLMDELKLQKEEKLTFVHEIIYNTDPVTLLCINQQAGSVSAKLQNFFKFKIFGINGDEITFRLPEKKTLAYSLMDIETDDGVLRIPPKWTSRELLVEEIIWPEKGKGLEVKQNNLKDLVYLPESIRRGLLNNLRELLKDRDNLTLLDKTWHQDSTGESDRPQSVSSFMELLQSSSTSTSQKDAVHLLISTMDTLPDDLPPLLTSCSPDTLRVLNQLGDRLKADAQTKLPESLPPPLQEEGELRWMMEFLCASDDTLKELSDQWDKPELPVAKLLEALNLVIQGLSLLQPKEDS